VRVAVSGATGFVGSAIARELTRRGNRVVALTRREPPGPAMEWRRYDLREAPDSGLLAGVDAVVHCAYDETAPLDDVEALDALLELARAAGARFVFVSSLASSGSAHSTYGLAKHRAESRLDLARDLVVRPGLVVGDGGLFENLASTIRRWGLAPVFDGGRQPVYVIGVGQLAVAVAALATRGKAGLYVLASPEPIALADLYRLIAARAGVQLRLVPVPYGVALAAVACLERLGIRLPVSSESLRGIANLAPVRVPSYEGTEFVFSDAAAAIDAVGTS